MRKDPYMLGHKIRPSSIGNEHLSQMILIKSGQRRRGNNR
jgi:hypothetical protein